MLRLIAILVIVTGCTTTQKPLIPCEELNYSLMNVAHDEFLIEACMIKIMSTCGEDSDCQKVEFLSCYEQYFSMKLKQYSDFRVQSCWSYHSEEL